MSVFCVAGGFIDPDSIDLSDICVVMSYLLAYLYKTS